MMINYYVNSTVQDTNLHLSLYCIIKIITIGKYIPLNIQITVTPSDKTGNTRWPSKKKKF